MVYFFYVIFKIYVPSTFKTFSPYSFPFHCLFTSCFICKRCLGTPEVFLFSLGRKYKPKHKQLGERVFFWCLLVYFEHSYSLWCLSTSKQTFLTPFCLVFMIWDNLHTKISIHHDQILHHLICLQECSANFINPMLVLCT